MRPPDVTQIFQPADYSLGGRSGERALQFVKGYIYEWLVRLLLCYQSF